MQHFIMKIPNKRALKHIALNNWTDIDFKDLMKLHKNYTKEPISFLLAIQLYHQMKNDCW